VICPPGLAPAQVEALRELARSTGARVVVVPDEGPARVEGSDQQVAVLLPVGDYSVEDLVVTIRKCVDGPDQAAARHLAALQRSLSTSLGQDQPVPHLLDRLKKQYSATFTLIDRQGHAVHTTGPLPLTRIFEQISRTDAGSQRVSLDGWAGIATRIAAVEGSAASGGWLVAVTRRGDLSDQLTTAAVHVAGTLIETSQRVTAVAREQERAVQAAVLEEAVALRPVRGDKQLTGRIAGLGISFGGELRVAVLRPRSTRADSLGTKGLAELDTAARQLLASAHVPLLTTQRDGLLTVLMQCSPKDLRRLLISNPASFAGVTVGVGRRVAAVEGVADSYNDAQLALRVLRRRSRGAMLTSYEDFDTASRLFADVGLERMQEWAHAQLRALRERSGLFEALVVYFDHDQNINSAARELGIHHNSLRYRLAKVEEVLGISLRSPSSIASMYLALTALELSHQEDRQIRPGRQSAPDTDASGTATAFAGERTNPGVVRGPDA
jgi:ActR/RegA family two-component response regulator